MSNLQGFTSHMVFTKWTGFQLKFIRRLVSSLIVLWEICKTYNPHRAIVRNFRAMLKTRGYIAQCANAACVSSKHYVPTHISKYLCPLD